MNDRASADDAVRLLLEHAVRGCHHKVYLSVAGTLMRAAEIEYPRGRMREFLATAPTFAQFFHLNTEFTKLSVSLKKRWRWNLDDALAQHARIRYRSALAARDSEANSDLELEDRGELGEDARAGSEADFWAKLQRLTLAEPPTAAGAGPPTPMQSLGPAELLQRAECGVCLEHARDTALCCGHVLCAACARNVSRCPVCRRTITQRIRLFL